MIFAVASLKEEMMIDVTSVKQLIYTSANAGVHARIYNGSINPRVWSTCSNHVTLPVSSRVNDLFRNIHNRLLEKENQ